MTISEKAKAVTEKIYAYYGSGSGFLFGIPPELRHAVEAVIKVALGRDWDVILARSEESD